MCINIYSLLFRLKLKVTSRSGRTVSCFMWPQICPRKQSMYLASQSICICEEFCGGLLVMLYNENHGMHQTRVYFPIKGAEYFCTP